MQTLCFSTGELPKNYPRRCRGHLVTQTPIRAVVFDAVGTLIHPDPHFGAVYAEVGKRFGSRVDLTSMQDAFRSAFLRRNSWIAMPAGKPVRRVSSKRWRTIVGEVLHDVTDPEACFAALYEHFSQPTHWRCDPAAPTIFAALGDRGYRVAVASNFDHRLRRVAAGLPGLAALPDIVISSEVGWRKPAAEFFAAVTRKAEGGAGRGVVCRRRSGQ